MFGEPRGAALHVLVKRVAAIDDKIAGRQYRPQRLQRGLGHIARGQHQPDDARRVQRVDQLLQGLASLVAGFFRNFQGHIVTAIQHRDMRALPPQPARHIRAHTPQPNNAKLHVVLLYQQID